MERLELARLLTPSAVGGPVPRRVEEFPAGRIIVEERDPSRFMEVFAQAVASGREVFLADPGWGANERAALAALTPADQTGDLGWLMIPSGGTSGRLKFARHDEETIAAAVRGFCTHFGVSQASCVGLLPLHHVSGLMAWMRSALTGATYLPWDWKRLEAGDFPSLTRGAGGWFLSLVPTQLQRLLTSVQAVAWLRGFEAVFVGGGPVWPELAEAAARAQLPISLSYGMTETAAMVAALRPREFRGGARSCGAPLPHARIDLTPEGTVRIAGGSVFRGYYPAWSKQDSLATEDQGNFDAQGHLSIHGRRDAIIITGGKKVDPREVEAALRASGQFTDVAVVGVSDPEWGQAVVACYPESQPAPDMARVVAHLAAFAFFKRPRRYVPIKDWPRNAQGKLPYAAFMSKLSS